MINLTLSLVLALALLEPAAPATVSTSVQTEPQKDALRVYPTPNRQGSLTVASAVKQTVSFFLFDLEGNLVYENRFEKNEQQTVAGLAAGTYTYHAFLNDEALKGGQVEIRH